MAVPMSSSAAGFGSEKNEDDAHVSGDKGVFVLAIRNDNAASGFAGSDGDYSGLAVDDRGRLFVRMMERKIKLSGSTDGQPIAVTGTSSPGQTIDTTSGLNSGEGYAYFLKASFVTQAGSETDCTLTIEFGAAGVGNQQTFKIPIEDTIIVIAGDVLFANSKTITAFVGTTGQQVNIIGWKELVAA